MLKGSAENDINIDQERRRLSEMDSKNEKCLEKYVGTGYRMY